MHIFDRQDERDCAVIGVDDDYSRAVFAEYGKLARRNRIGVVPVALDRPARGGHFVPRRQADRCRRLSSPTSPTCRPCRATTMRRMPPAPGRPAAGCGVVARGDHPRDLADYPGLPHRQERVAALGKVDLRQRQQGDQRRRHGARAVVLPQHLLDPRRPGEGGRRRAARALLRPHPPRLPDRRGDRAVRRPARGQAAVRPLRRSAVGARTPRMRARRPRRRRRRWCCCRRPAPRGTSGAATSIAAMRSARWRARCRAPRRVGRAA